MKVGDLVVCINDVFTSVYADQLRKNGVKFPIKEKIYTIRRIERLRGETGLFLEEIKNPKTLFKDCFEEQSWHIDRFRKIDTIGDQELQETISKILKPSTYTDTIQCKKQKA